ncbi:MAG: SDR family oxidoreductase [Actinomycetales bacterium]|nr:MAG: SDR family oxidoreductase [Actinomycetales bacterium]
MRIAVAGGTGMVGRHVVQVAQERGHDVLVLSRGEGVDLLTAEGLVDSLAGVEVVVDVTSVQTQRTEESEAFFGTVTRHLLAAGAEAGVTHHVVLSIVGVDAAPEGYYAGKVLQEQLVLDGPVPSTVLRATQFHEFAQQLHGSFAFGPVMVVPRMRSQPVAAREVAERLVDLAVGPPAGRTTDLGGPGTLRMVDMVRAYGRAVGDRRRVVAVPLPGRFGRAMRDGSLVADQDADHGTQTFEQWLGGVESP